MAVPTKACVLVVTLEDTLSEKVASNKLNHAMLASESSRGVNLTRSNAPVALKPYVLGVTLLKSVSNPVGDSKMTPVPVAPVLF